MSASEQVAGASGTILPAPAGVLLADGSPAFGAYAGNVEAVDWSGLNAALRRTGLWRRFHHKRWQYVGIAVLL